MVIEILNPIARAHWKFQYRSMKGLLKASFYLNMKG